MAYPHKQSFIAVVLVTLWHIIVVVVVAGLVLRVIAMLANWLGGLRRNPNSKRSIVS
jgi:hypothetical protein